jgi:hypothetical protein
MHIMKSINVWVVNRTPLCKKITVLWDVLPCSLVEISQYYPRHWSSKLLQNTSKFQPDNTVPHLWRQLCSQLLLWEPEISHCLVCVKGSGLPYEGAGGDLFLSIFLAGSIFKPDTKNWCYPSHLLSRCLCASTLRILARTDNIAITVSLFMLCIPWTEHWKGEKMLLLVRRFHMREGESGGGGGHWVCKH